MTRLGGWTRLGMVLSTVWLLAVVSFAAIEYRAFATERANNLALPAPPKGFVIDPKAQGFFFTWQPIELLAESSSAHVRDFQLNLGRSFAVLVGPPAGLWILIWLVVFLMRWIRAGFRATNRDG